MAFWGLVLEPKKKYSQAAVELPFHVSMAALDIQNCDPNEEASSVVLRKGEADFVLCSLSKKKGILNVPLNLEFELGGAINFHILGNSSIHLTGYIVEEEMEGFDSDDSLEEEDEEESKTDLFKNTKKLLEESTSKRKPDGSAQNKAKKAKVEAGGDEEDDDDSDDDFYMEDDDSDDLGEEEEDDSDDDDADDDDEDDDDEEADAQKKSPEVKKQKPGDKKSGKQNNVPAQNSQQGNKDKKAKNQNAPQQQNKGQTPQQNKAANGSQPQSNGLAKRTIDGGVQVEEVRVGNGPVAKRGKMVSVYYVGRLKQNNKQFDATQSGQGFKFRLGAGEVIKGWDVGVVGMKVGSKRRLTIPAKMAYGQRGAPPTIPPNSTLVFDVELKNIM